MVKKEQVPARRSLLLLVCVCLSVYVCVCVCVCVSTVTGQTDSSFFTSLSTTSHSPQTLPPPHRNGAIEVYTHPNIAGANYSKLVRPHFGSSEIVRRGVSRLEASLRRLSSRGISPPPSGQRRGEVQLLRDWCHHKVPVAIIITNRVEPIIITNRVEPIIITNRVEPIIITTGWNPL